MTEEVYLNLLTSYMIELATVTDYRLTPEMVAHNWGLGHLLWVATQAVQNRPKNSAPLQVPNWLECEGTTTQVPQLIS